MTRSLPLLACGGMLLLTACGSSTGPSQPSESAGAVHLRLIGSHPQAESRRATGDDVYILHGLASDGEAMSALFDRVVSLGIYRRVFALDYRDDLSVRETGRALSEMIQANSPVSCDLVGHSLGGLVIRWALEQAGLGPRARKVWLMGTPNLGSELASAGLSGSLVDLQPGSETLRILNDGPRVVNAAYSYYTIAGDLIVAGRRTGTDGVVCVNSANWSGLGLHAKSLTRSSVDTSHFGLKSSPAALNQLEVMMRVQAAKP